MSFNALNQYSANHKTWDHVGNIVPNVEHSEGERPHFEFKPAEWLPVQFYDKYFEVWYVVMPGKAVALDPDGRVMPAQYGLTSQTVVYTQNDVDAGVIDVATGLPVTTAKTVTLSNLTGVRDATWTQANAGVGAVTSGFMGRYGVAFGDATAKYPVGVAPYPYFQWAGGDGSNPANYRQHNFNMQHQVAVLCDYVLKLPLIPAQVATETVDKTVSGSNLVFGTRAVHTRAQAVANSTGRYNASYGTVPILPTYKVIAFALDEVDLAKQTSRTTYTLTSTTSSDDVSDVLVNEVSHPAAVQQPGDYFIDYPVGVIFVYSADATSVPGSMVGAAGTVQLTYYRNSAAASTVSKFACVVGASVTPGMFLKVGADSNLVPATTEDFKEIVGQVIGLDKNFPKDGLDRVRTAYNPALATDASGAMANGSLSSASVNTGQLDQMPGSANGGYPDLLSYAGAADTLVIVNLVSR